jgi:hypothetical protein
MFELITRSRRFDFASRKVEEFTSLPLRNTPLEARLREYFYTASEPKEYSEEVSVAMLLLLSVCYSHSYHLAQFPHELRKPHHQFGGMLP